jgi:F-type H+-transporting ATPase subunit a
VSKKRVGCGCLGCSIPLITFIILLVLIVPISIWGFKLGGFTHSNNPQQAYVPPVNISLPAEVIFHIGPLPVTNTIIASWLTVALLIIIALVVTRKPKLIPNRIQSMMEAIIEWLYNFCKDTAGEKNGRKFFPLVATIFLFVGFNALMNLIPGYNSITYGEAHLIRGANTDINTALALSIISFVCVTYWGIQANKLGFFKQFFNPGRFIKGLGQLFTGKFKSSFGNLGFGFLDMFVGILELISYLIRLISFTFRLFGNMLGGEILVLVLFYLLVFGGFGIIPGIYGFEMLIGVIQALIFAGLTLVFASMAVASHGEEEHT